ncbi:sulfatase family protein [Roseibacillus ishigakijimensis]|uniref:Arylsulfatase n=1 Tax=Roseibacillus ishigakijimensis TaxID=454146 RepID=A0A934VMM1_9BACT|nr:arylsulfatase [Roseibacillus ishigakijimensis]MBK1834422.1 arylsulfatase [Roseibacillus ishigakijimensis]
MIRPLFLTTLLLAGLPLLFAKSPNVILIFADDLGYGDLGCYGATHVRTPNIDQLAKEGRRFTDAHSASAVCTPSRYALLTGSYPSRAKGGEGLWGPAPINSPLLIAPDTFTLADLFQKEGYATAALGKWHLGFGEEANDWQPPLRPGPQDLGFDFYFGLPVVNSAPPYLYVENDRFVGEDPDDPLIFIGRKRHSEATPITPIPKEASQRTANQFKGARRAHEHYNDYEVGTVLTEKATAWITTHRQQPFFLYLATTHIHHPFTPAPRFQGTSEAGLYGDYIHELDWMVGEILTCLEENQLTEDTLVIFTSDNGGMLNSGGRVAVQKGHLPNGDLLGFKFGAWEGGHRVPFIARWPGKIPPTTVSPQLLSHLDLMATLHAALGKEKPPQAGPDSLNLLPALTEEPSLPLREELLLAAHRPSHLSLRQGPWMYIPARGSGGFTGSKPSHHAWGGPPAVAFVQGKNSDLKDGKLRQDAPPAQLYNLAEDPNQRENLYHSYPDKVREMATRLDQLTPENPASSSKK